MPYEPSAPRAWTEPYGADLALKVRAPDLAGAYREAAVLLGEVLAAGDRRPAQERKLALSARDRESLLVALMEEILFLFETEGLLPADLRLESLSDTALTGILDCDRFDPQRHAPGHGVKAVTWHDLQVRDFEAGISLTLILDL